MRYVVVILLLLWCACAVWAHDDEEHETESAEVADIEDIAVPEDLGYHEHVRPIIEASCTTCHIEGQIAGDIPLTNPEEIVFVAEDIAFHVVTRNMPPWMPSPQSRPLKHERGLSDEEIAIIAAWAEQGAPLGDAKSYAPAADGTQAIPQIRRDLALLPEAPYAPAGDILDDYRCYPLPLDISEPQFITGYEVLPDVTEMAHHAIVFLLDEEADEEILRRNYEDGRPGWPCYGGVDIFSNAGTIGAWTPGALPVQHPPGTGHLISPGETVVIQMHYNLAITRQPDQSGIDLQLEPADSGIAELVTLPLVAPVEIPCPRDVEGPQCERDFAIQRTAELYGERFKGLSDRRLRLCRQRLEDYASNTGEHAVGSCDITLPMATPDLTAFGVYGHMHELGTSFRFELNPESDNPILLLDIPRWDFDWQDSYQFVEPVEIVAGDILRMTCTWDNSLSDDPRYVVWGEGTTDEMCLGTLTLLKPERG